MTDLKKTKQALNLGARFARDDDTTALDELLVDPEAVAELVRLVDYDLAGLSEPSGLDELRLLARKAIRYPASGAIDRMHEKLTARTVLGLLRSLDRANKALRETSVAQSVIPPDMLQEREELLTIKREHERECASLRQNLDFCRKEKRRLEQELEASRANKDE